MVCTQSLCHSTYSATRTSFCTVTQGDCAYQYFVGTTESAITSDNAVVEVMEPGKLWKLKITVLAI